MSSRDAKIERIVEAALRAPTPENSQPWTFTWDGEQLCISFDPARGQMAPLPHEDDAWFCLGTVQESISIASSVENLEPRFLPARALRAGQPMVRVTFQDEERIDDPLHAVIWRRCTDRREFRGGGMELPVFREIQALLPRYPEAGLYLNGAERAEDWAFLIQAENQSFEWPPFARAITRWFRLTEKEIRTTRDGLPYRSLGAGLLTSRLMLLQRRMGRLAGYLLGLVARFSNLAPFYDFRDVAALGCVTVTPRDARSLSQAGRLLMRTWLLLHSHGLAFQPLTNVAFLSYLLRERDTQIPDWLAQELLSAQAGLIDRFGVPAGQWPFFVFRTGIAPGGLPPDSRTLRRELHCSYRKLQGEA